MIDFADPSTGQLRLSNAERDAAISQLAAYGAEGRLDEREVTERSTTARSAITRGDLAPLFADLPMRGVEGEPGRPGYSGWTGGWSSQRSLGRAIVALMPFAALILFFITGNIVGFSYAWLWFLLIPVAGIVVYGVGEYDHGHRR